MRPSTRTLNVSAALVSLLAMLSLVAYMSAAAFSDTTGNGTNNFAAGSVTITDDDAGAVLFDLGAGSHTDAADLKPGDVIEACIEISYTGSLDADIRFYAADDAIAGEDLADYLDLVVERGTGGSYNDCTGFSAAATVFDSGTSSDGDADGTAGELSDLYLEHSSFATGADTWDTTTDGTTNVYRFQLTVQDDNGAQSETAAATFTWEAQNQ